VYGIFALLCLVVLLVFGVWWTTMPKPVLLRELPSGSSWYVSFAIPRTPRWYDVLLFWTRGSMASPESARLLQGINVVGWDENPFAQRVLPLLRGTLELGHTGADVVLRAPISDMSLFVSRFGAGIVPQEITLTENSVFAQAAGTTTAFWMVRDQGLYVSTERDVDKILASKKTRSLSVVNTLPGIGGGVASAYVAHKEAFGSLGAYASLLPESATYPLGMRVRNEKGDWKLELLQKDKIFNQEKAKITHPIRASDTELLRFQLSAVGEWYTAFRALDAGSRDTMQHVEDFARDFYGIRFEQLADILGETQVRLVIEAPDGDAAPEWVYVIQSEQESETLFEELKNVGASFFAISHPNIVERVLNDNTIMSELRADTEGLDWQSIPWQYNGASFNLSLLRGQGEPRGQYLGYISGVGYVGATSLKVLERELTRTYNASISDKSDRACEIEYPISSFASMSGTFLFNDAFVSKIVRGFDIASGADGSLGGCLRF